jgi:hypothetical protein
MYDIAISGVCTLKVLRRLKSASDTESDNALRFRVRLHTEYYSMRVLLVCRT